MRFSVVVNTLNRAPSLRDTLESLRFQRHDDFEVVVVNGPSTDHTEEMLAQYEGRIKHLRCPVANLSMSRNIGIRAAAGDVVAFIDDDAIPEYDWLAELEHGYLVPPDGIAIEEVGGVGGVVFDYTGTRFQFRFAVSDRHGESAFLDAPPDPAMCVPGGWLYPSLMGTNSSFRREALAAIGLFDETYEYYLDETDVAVRMVDAGYVVLGIDGAPVHHHFLPSHLRNEAKVVTHWYPVVKNRTYFAMRHARSHRPVTDVIRAAIDAGDVRLAESDSAEQAGLIAKGSTDRARLDADRGLLDGIVLGERAGSKCAPAVTLSPPPFVSFPTLPHANRLRIGLVSAGYPPRPMAGIARFISELAPALAALGHDVRVFTRATGHPTVEWEDGVWVHRIGDQHRGLVPGSFDHVDDFATGVVREIERIQPWLPLDCVYGGAWDVETIGVVRATEIPTTIMLATPARERPSTVAGWPTRQSHRACGRCSTSSASCSPAPTMCTASARLWCTPSTSCTASRSPRCRSRLRPSACATGTCTSCAMRRPRRRCSSSADWSSARASTSSCRPWSQWPRCIQRRTSRWPARIPPASPSNGGWIMRVTSWQTESSSWARSTTSSCISCTRAPTSWCCRRATSRSGWSWWKR
ncbi:MAG: glycosyltransferase [Acidimicrobiaceae bacterium]|nr:glycosyltransferase [Acidimicrobiaceae bacterium]